METDVHSSAYAQKPKIVTRFIAGETLLVPISGNLADMQRIFTLNPVAAFIWEALDGKTGFDHLCQGIIARFEVSKEQAEKDLTEFLHALNDAGLVQTAGQTTA